MGATRGGAASGGAAPAVSMTRPLKTRRTTTKNTGTKKMARSVEAIMPPKTAVPSACRLAVTLGFAQRELGMGCGKPSRSFLIIEADEQIARRDFVVRANQHFSDATERDRADADLARPRLDAPGRSGDPERRYRQRRVRRLFGEQPAQ